MKQVKLTEYSHGAGCGCKISPVLLDEILKSSIKTSSYSQLLVGNKDKDDAAAYDLGNGTSSLSTTDFFMPIVDDPFTFGQIAARSYGSKISEMSQVQQEILCDAQTSGGLLVVVEKDGVDSFLELSKSYGLSLEAIGETTAQQDKVIEVI